MKVAQTKKKRVRSSLQHIMEMNSDRACPVLSAQLLWNKVSDHIEDILGPEIQRQWFQKLVPLVISQDALILKAPNKFSTYWVNSQYRDLINSLISIYQSNVECFIIEDQSQL